MLITGELPAVCDAEKVATLPKGVGKPVTPFKPLDKVCDEATLKLPVAENGIVLRVGPTPGIVTPSGEELAEEGLEPLRGW